MLYGDWLDPACPIDWLHPLNRGLVDCWMVAPNAGWRGGLTLRDLVRGGHVPHDGTLTNIAFPATSTSGWTGAKGRPGGYGSLALDGSDDYVQTQYMTGSAPATGTVSWWMRPALAYNAGVNQTFWGAYITPFGAQIFSDNNWYVGWESPDRRVTLAASAANFTQNVWQWYAFTWGATGSVLYRNALSIGSNGTAPATVAITDALKIGQYSYNGSLPFNGNLDDFQLRTNTLPASQIRDLYRESCLGYPNSMRWIGAGPRWFIPPIGGTTSDGAGSATGSCTVAGVGAALAAAAGSATGAGTAAGVGAALAASAGASAGSATAAGAGAALAAAAGSSTGSATAAAVGAALAEAVGSSTGAGTAAGVGAALAAGVGTCTGSATVSGTGASLVVSVGTAAGVATVSGTGAALADAVGLSTGSALVSGIGVSLAGAVGLAMGSGSATGSGAALSAARGVAAGTCTVIGISTAPEPAPINVLELVGCYDPIIFLRAQYDPVLELTGCYDPVIELRAQPMPAAIQNVSIPGDNKVLEFTVYQADGVTPQNISGWAFILEVHNTAGDVFFSRTGNEWTIVSAVDGKVRCAITPADAALLRSRVPYYFNFRRAGTSLRDTLTYGRWTFLFT